MSIACRTEGSGNKSPNMFKLDFSCSQCNYLLKSLVRLAIVILMQPTANWSGGQIFGERRHWALDGTSGVLVSDRLDLLEPFPSIASRIVRLLSQTNFCEKRCEDEGIDTNIQPPLVRRGQHPGDHACLGRLVSWHRCHWHGREVVSHILWHLAAIPRKKKKHIWIYLERQEQKIGPPPAGLQR